MRQRDPVHSLWLCPHALPPAMTSTAGSLTSHMLLCSVFSGVLISAPIWPVSSQRAGPWCPLSSGASSTVAARAVVIRGWGLRLLWYESKGVAAPTPVTETQEDMGGCPSQSHCLVHQLFLEDSVGFLSAPAGFCQLIYLKRN